MLCDLIAASLLALFSMVQFLSFILSLDKFMVSCFELLVNFIQLIMTPRPHTRPTTATRTILSSSFIYELYVNLAVHKELFGAMARMAALRLVLTLLRLNAPSISWGFASLQLILQNLKHKALSPPRHGENRYLRYVRILLLVTLSTVSIIGAGTWVRTAADQSELFARILALKLVIDDSYNTIDVLIQIYNGTSQLYLQNRADTTINNTDSVYSEISEVSCFVEVSRACLWIAVIIFLGHNSSSSSSNNNNTETTSITSSSSYR